MLKNLLNKAKRKKLKKLQKKSLTTKTKTRQPEVGTLAGLEKDKSGLMSKGIQTMLRLTSENHLKLSDMADHKANILISVNSIIISVILGVLLRKLQEEPYLTIPTVIFLISAVTTIVISILATRPKISEGHLRRKILHRKKPIFCFLEIFIKQLMSNTMQPCGK